MTILSPIWLWGDVTMRSHRIPPVGCKVIIVQMYSDITSEAEESYPGVIHSRTGIAIVLPGYHIGLHTRFL